MTDDDDVNQPRCLDIGDDGIDPLGDGGRFEVARLAAVAGKVDGEHVLFGCLLVQFLDGEIPAVASVSATVDEDQRGRCLGSALVALGPNRRQRRVFCCTHVVSVNVWCHVLADRVVRVGGCVVMRDGSHPASKTLGQAERTVLMVLVTGESFLGLITLLQQRGIGTLGEAVAASRATQALAQVW